MVTSREAHRGNNEFTGYVPPEVTRHNIHSFRYDRVFNNPAYYNEMPIEEPGSDIMSAMPGLALIDMEACLDAVWSQLTGSLSLQSMMSPEPCMNAQQGSPAQQGRATRRGGQTGEKAAAGSPEEKALAKGYTKEQIKAAREKVEKGGDDDEICTIAEDPLCMLVATPEEKAKMIKQLIKGWTKDREDRAIVSILQSAEDKQEFDAIMNSAGGKEVGEELDDDEAKKKYNRLCGAYNRTDLATDQAEAEKCKGVLCDEEKQEELLGGADSETIQPEMDYYGSYTGFGANDGGASQFQKNQRSKINSQVSSLDRRTVVETVTENAVRKQEGKPLINPRDIRQEVDAIMNDPSLSKEEREKKINEIREKNGLSEYTMRNIATQPISLIYDRASTEAQGFAQEQLGQLQNELKITEAVYGKNSPQANAIREKMKNFSDKMSPYIQNLSSVSQELNEMYPPPVSWVESALDFLGGMLGSVVPALLNLIPGVGTALYAGYQAVKGIVNIVKGDITGFLGDIAGALPGFGGIVGNGLGEAFKTGATVLRTGLGLGNAIASGNPLAILGTAAGAAGNVANLTGAGGDVTGFIQKGTKYMEQGLQISYGIASGNVEGILGGLGSLSTMMGGFAETGSTFSDITKYAGQGINFTGSLVNGNYASAFNTIGNLTGDAQAQEIFGYAGRGATFLTDAINGNYTRALGQVTDVLGNLDDPIARDIAGKAKEGVSFFTNLSNGSFGSALTDLNNAAGSFMNDPAVARIKEYVNQAEQIIGNFRNNQITQGASQFISSVADGDLQNALSGLGNLAGVFSQDPAVQKALEMIREGSSFMGGLQSGSIAQDLALLNERYNNVPEINEAIQNALNITSRGTTFVNSITSGTLVNSLLQSNRGAQSQPEMQMLRDSSEFIQALCSGRFYQELVQYTGNLGILANGIPQDIYGQIMEQAKCYL